MFDLEILLGIVSDMMPKIGFTPFAAKSLTHDTMLYLAASSSFIPGGRSVLSTNVSTFATK